MQRKYRTIPVGDEEFAALFPHHTDRELAALWGTTRQAVYCKARRLGLKKSPEHLKRARRLAADAIRGERNYAWKGGKTARLREGDPRYRPWRDAVLARDNYTCTHCGDRRRRCEMNAHHIKGYADYEALRYDLDNGTTLCRPCHERLHGLLARPRIQIPCKCGCGTLIDAVDKWGYAREWVKNHNHRGETRTPEQRAAIAKGAEKRRGYRHTQEAKDKMAATRRARARTEAELAGFARRKSYWADRHECCVSCGRTDAPHKGRGLCLPCYRRERKQWSMTSAGLREDSSQYF